MRTQLLRHFSSSQLPLWGVSGLALLIAGCSGGTSRFAERAFQDEIVTGSLTPTVAVGQPTTTYTGQTSQAAPQMPQYGYFAPQPTYQAQTVGQPQPGYQAQPAFTPLAQTTAQARYQPPSSHTVLQTVDRPAPVTRHVLVPQTVPSQVAKRSTPVTHEPPVARPGKPLGHASLTATVPEKRPHNRVVKTKTIMLAEDAHVATPAVAPKRTSASPSASNAGVHTVAAGDTLYGISRAYGVSVRQVAAANAIDDAGSLKIGQTLAIPKSGQQIAKSVQTANLNTSGVRNDVTPRPYVPPKSASPTPAATAPGVASRPRPVAPRAAPSSNGKFRWPTEGRIISSFGAKSDGAHNDGINIAAPEGTPIRAARGGVVAYAGDELKGFGNLILIRHADDWVTAYAHARDINVKRGQQISPGEIIGKVGKTGAVSTPQLHFEVRNGSRPVDPVGHLTKA